jgi:penicillin-binding protein 2
MGVALSFLDFDSNEKNFKTNCDGAIKLGKRNFRCWKHKGHKKTTMKKAIRESCDVFFYKGSLKVGIDNMHNTLDMFGLGKKTGIDLPKEHYGRNPSKNWKKQSIKTSWVKGDTVNASIGQGFVLVTPMQIARYTSALATSVLTTPHFLKDDSLIKNKILNIPQKDLQTIRKGMFDVCNTAGGTATKHINTKIVIAGKTGTAQVIAIRKNKKRLKEHELKYMNRSHAWLTTYGPYKNPKYSITLLIEHGGHGGSAGGEIVSKIYNKMYYLGYFD